MNKVLQLIILAALSITVVSVGWYLSPRDDVGPNRAAQAEPMAPNQFKRFMSRQGFKRFVYGSSSLFNDRPLNDVDARPTKDLTPVYRHLSLADDQVCRVLGRDGLSCAERFGDTMPSCRLANTPMKFLCGCRGHGDVPGPNGTRTLDGFLQNFTILPDTDCPSPPSNGCAVMMSLQANQWWAIKQASADDDASKFPAALQALLVDMTNDTAAGRNRAALPACLRARVPVRAGRREFVPAEDEPTTDGGAP